MKSIIFALFLLYTISTCLTPPIALIVKSKGNVNKKVSGATTESPVKQGEMVIAGTTLKTGDDGLALIKLTQDNALVRMASRSVFIVNPTNENSKNQRNGRVGIGAVLFDVKKRLGNSTFEVETPTSVATVKGTRFWIIVPSDSVSILVTLEGSVEFTNSTTGQKKMVQTGMSGFITKDSLSIKPTNLKDIPPDVEGSHLKFLFKNDKGETKELDIDYEETP